MAQIYNPWGTLPPQQSPKSVSAELGDKPTQPPAFGERNSPRAARAAIETLRAKVAILKPQADAFDALVRGSDIPYDLPKRMIKLSPRQFEHLAAEFLKAKGFVNVHATPLSHDDGIDGYGEMPSPSGNKRMAFQAKRYTKGNVGIAYVKKFMDDMAKHGKLDLGIFVTTSGFARKTREWVEDSGAPITLVDGNQLAKELARLGLGMRMRLELDEDFFNSLRAPALQGKMPLSDVARAQSEAARLSRNRPGILSTPRVALTPRQETRI